MNEFNYIIALLDEMRERLSTKDYYDLLIGIKSHCNEIIGVYERNNDINIMELDLSIRSFNCLRRAGIYTVSELIGYTETDMMKVRNLGRKSLQEIKNKLADMGLRFKGEDEEWTIKD